MTERLAELVGRRVRELRKLKDMDQGALGALVGMHKTTVSYLERGKRPMSLDMLQDLAKVLGTTPARLVAEPECECFGESGLHASTHWRDGHERCDLCHRPVRLGAVDVLTAINTRKPDIPYDDGGA